MTKHHIPLTQAAMRDIVQRQLAVDLNCTVADLTGERDRFVFVIAADNAARRPFPRPAIPFDMVTMGRSIVISSTPEIVDALQPRLAGVTRDEAFALPFVHGHSLYYLPDSDRMQRLPPPPGFSFKLLEDAQIPALYAQEGFRNALGYGSNPLIEDVLVTLAIAPEPVDELAGVRVGELVAEPEREPAGARVVGMAGASADCPEMWQVGMDVLPQWRNRGLAAFLVNWLTREILQRGRVPYYGTASSNIASQRVAHRAGYQPAWMCAYQGNLVAGALQA